MSKVIGQETIASPVVDRIVTKNEAFFRLISDTSQLTRDEQLALLHTAIPSTEPSKAELFALQMIKANIRCVRRNRRQPDPLRAWS